MNYDRTKVDETILALMFLMTFKDHEGPRAWKGLDWEALDRLHNAGLIDNPKTKSRSVGLTKEGRRRSEELFFRMFGM